MHYSQHSLPAPLARHVECVWFLRADRPRAAAAPERIVPDGCAELIIQLAAPCRAARPGEPLTLQPRALLVGPMTRSLFVAPTGAVSTMGIRFRPGGLAPFLSASAGEVAGRGVALDDLWGSDAIFFEEKLREASDDGARLRAAAQFLRARLHDPEAPEGRVERAVRRMLRRRGPVPVEGLARDFGISRRHLERAFRSETGLTPMRLGRLIRFQSVFRAVAGEADWVSVALDCGYYDQSHLIRDFQEFAGETPAAFLREEGAFERVFLSPARMERLFGSHPSNTEPVRPA
jgi:methylphosphotriester-DNA--protein-cysteine methyltransferase